MYIKRANLIPFFGWILSLLLIVLFSLLVFATLTPQQVSVYINSDTLYLPSIFRDIFIDSSGLKGWNLNAAPNFFPDFLIYSAINFVFPDFRVAALIYSLLQILIIALLFNAILKALSKDVGYAHLTVTNLLLLLFPLSALISGDFIFTFYIYSISYHTGAFIMAMVSLLITLRALNMQGKWNLMLLAISVFLGVFNDKLFIPAFVFPLVAVIPYLFDNEKRAIARQLLITTISFTVISLVAFWGIKKLGFISIISTDWKMFNFSNIIPSFNVMFTQYANYIKNGSVSGVVIILTLFVFIVLSVYLFPILRQIYRDVKGRSRVRLSTQNAFALFAWFFIPVVVFTPVINGSYFSPAILRFNIHAYYFGVLLTGFLLFLLFRNRKAVANLSGVSVVIALVLLVSIYNERKTDVSLQPLLGYYPERIACIDSVALETQCKYGIATYWDAKLTTMLSKQGVRLYHVFPDLKIWYHVTNKNWYYKQGKGIHANPKFRLIVMNGFDSTKVVQVLGRPLEILTFPEVGTEVWLMNEFEFDAETRAPSVIRP